MNNIFKIVVIFLTISSCSFNKNSKFWTNEKISKDQKTKIEKIFALTSTSLKKGPLLSPCKKNNFFFKYF